MVKLKKQKVESTQIHGYLDMDCFECQVRQLLDPGLRGLPCAVINKYGRVISVNYEARKFNVKRHQGREEASLLCPDLNFLLVPVDDNGKSDHSILYTASHQVFNVVKEFCEKHFEAGSFLLHHYPSDEIHLDLSRQCAHSWKHIPTHAKLLYFVQHFHGRLKKTWAKTFLDSIPTFLFATFLLSLLLVFLRLIPQFALFMPPCLVAFVILLGLYDKESVRQFVLHGHLRIAKNLMERISQEVYDKTNMTASAGVGTTKFQAKLASSVLKPSGFYILYPEEYTAFISVQKIKCVPGLKQKLGQKIRKHYDIETIGELNLINMDEAVATGVFTRKEAVVVKKIFQSED